MYKCIAALFIGLLAVNTQAGAALLDGQPVGMIYFRGTAPDTTLQIGPISTVVGPGIELTNFADFIAIDVSDTNILITANRPANLLSFFELVRFADLVGAIPAFTGVTINPATNFAGLTASDINFTADTIDVNLTALPAQTGQIISLDLIGAGPGAVPEPGSCVLVCLGVAAISGFRRLVKR